MRYVLALDEEDVKDGRRYVAKPGLPHPYTYKLEEVLVFSNRTEAEHDCCGNETPIPLGDIIW